MKRLPSKNYHFKMDLECCQMNRRTACNTLYRNRANRIVFFTESHVTMALLLCPGNGGEAAVSCT